LRFSTFQFFRKIETKKSNLELIPIDFDKKNLIASENCQILVGFSLNQEVQKLATKVEANIDVVGNKDY
jgi:hypothetical protein